MISNIFLRYVFVFSVDNFAWSTVHMISSGISPFPIMDHSVMSLVEVNGPSPSTSPSPVSPVRVTADRRLPEASVSPEDNALDCRSNASTVSIDDCDVELADLASVILPGSVSDDQLVDGLKSLQTSAVKQLAVQEMMMSGHMKAVEHGEASTGRSLCSEYSVDMYVMGGRLGSCGASFGRLTLWHCCIHNT